MIDPTRDPWLAFYLGHGFDHRGRTLEQIWGYSDRSLEAVHDYIQWLFPLPTPSPYNPEAPLLTPERAAFVQGSAEMMKRLRTSLARMLRFYGFSLRYEGEAPRVEATRADPGDERVRPWISPGNHNYLRISRILGCLRGVGLGAEARAVLGALEQMYAADDRLPHLIGERSLGFWRASAGG